MNWFLAAIVCLFATVPPVRAAVVLNEISPRTDPEWVELYNDAATPVDLAGWKLVDKVGNTEYFATQSAIPATSYLVFTRAKGWLNDTSDESLFLYDVAGSLLDSVSYPSVKEGLTVARIPSVSGTWFTDQSPSLGFANPPPSPSLAPSPSPSPLASASPSPVASPVLASTPTPSPSPIPSPSAVLAGVVAPPPSSGRSISPGPSILLAAALPGTVAGVSEPEISLAGYGRSPAPPATQSAQGRSALTLNQSRLRLVLALGAGLVLLSLAGYLGYRAHQARKQTVAE